VKHLSILGSSGSIGTSTLDLVERLPGRLAVVALAGGRNVERLARQVERHRPELVAVADADAAAELARRVGTLARVVHGERGLVEVATHPRAELVVSALVGALGLAPTWAAVAAGRHVALANKESLVVAGAHLVRAARASGARILPVDSEHNALHQCLRGENPADVRRLWLTASGGPLRHVTPAELERVTPEQALRHPTWRMGPKVTVDSATLMNKGLEVIEARWLFDVPADRLRVVIHPQSVVHSMVEFVDGSFKAQLSTTDMRHPIQYALSYPERWPAPLDPLDPWTCGPLEFAAPDADRFPCLGLAYRALEEQGAAPAVLNAANEVAVRAFLDGRAGFADIPRIISRTLDDHGSLPGASLDDVLEADRVARAAAEGLLAPGTRR
jgi:1-deoxy-D-xylulose-5-phosphate reductoisomerase